MKTKNTATFPQTVEIPQPLEVHPSVSPKAAALLEGVIEILMREPEQYAQGTGIVAPECGAACCIFGHMHILLHGRPGRMLAKNPRDHAEFGLTKTQGQRIYSADLWPAPFTQRSDTCAVNPSIGIARIEHFLRTGE